MKYLLFISLVLMLSGCNRVYKNLAAAEGRVEDLNKFRPAFTTALYKARVNVISHYLSGLLMVKEMPDSTIRLLFSSEMGLKFFDFEFGKQGAFKVHYIIREMNRKPVIRTLRKDFELVMIRPGNEDRLTVKSDSSGLYYIFPNDKGYYTYLTASDGSRLRSMHRASKKRVIAEALVYQQVPGQPDSISIRHTTFTMDIKLNKIKR
ncbi:MAG TPA: hypothetical protein VK625_13555 [Flavitalea sp.]|nr:hypothetical protein [Flavitalea sp.]